MPAGFRATPKRTEQVAARFTKKERLALEKKARERQTTLSNLVRQAVLAELALS